MLKLVVSAFESSYILVIAGHKNCRNDRKFLAGKVEITFRSRSDVVAAECQMVSLSLISIVGISYGRKEPGTRLNLKLGGYVDPYYFSGHNSS